eukprot:1321366-Pleurochrysis_carterae.AAC.1
MEDLRVCLAQPSIKRAITVTFSQCGLQSRSSAHVCRTRLEYDRAQRKRKEITVSGVLGRGVVQPEHSKGANHAK